MTIYDYRIEYIPKNDYTIDYIHSQMTIEFSIFK